MANAAFSSRWYDRIAAIISISLLACLAAVSFYLAEKARRFDTPIAPKILTSDPDYFIEGFAVTKTTSDGTPSLRLTAKRAIHRPDKDGFDLQFPVAIGLDPSKASLRTSADRGYTEGDSDRTDLTGHVVIERSDPKTGEKLVIESEHIELYTEQDRARSSKFVTIKRAGSVVTGVGMEFNNGNRELKVLQDVKVNLAPKAP